MYKKIIFFLIIAAICTSVNAQIKSLVIKKLDASFSMKNGLVLVNGSFDKGIAAVQYNAAKPVQSMFTGSVDVATINTGVGLRDKHLIEKSEFFDAKKYPTIKMVSSKLIEKDGKIIVDWLITMKGITKTISAPVIIVSKSGILLFSTNFTINRRDFKVGTKSMLMADDVKVNLHVEAM
jgi:polyisoprenoid-binding protein YceI